VAGDRLTGSDKRALVLWVEARNRSSQPAELPNERVCHPTSGQGSLRLTPEGGRHIVLRKDKVEIGNSR
jgi:hypothetical protein